MKVEVEVEVEERWEIRCVCVCVCVQQAGGEWTSYGQRWIAGLAG